MLVVLRDSKSGTEILPVPLGVGMLLARAVGVALRAPPFREGREGRAARACTLLAMEDGDGGEESSA